MMLFVTGRAQSEDVHQAMRCVKPGIKCRQQDEKGKDGVSDAISIYLRIRLADPSFAHVECCDHADRDHKTGTQGCRHFARLSRNGHQFESPRSPACCLGERHLNQFTKDVIRRADEKKGRRKKHQHVHQHAQRIFHQPHPKYLFGAAALIPATLSSFNTNLALLKRTDSLLAVGICP